MARQILPLLAGAKKSPTPAAAPKGKAAAAPSMPDLSDLTPEELAALEAMLAGEEPAPSDADPDADADEDDGVADDPEADPDAAEDAAEDEPPPAGDGISDPNSHATAAAADAASAHGFEAQLQQYVEDTPDDKAAAASLKDCTKACAAADKASDAARAAADKGDLAKAAVAAQEAHEAMEEASKCLGGVLGAAAQDDTADPEDDVPVADDAESAPMSGAGMSPMQAWLSRQAR